MKQSVFTKAAFAATLTVGALVATASSASAQARLNIEGSANVFDQTPGGGGQNLVIDFLSGSPPTIGGTPTGTVRAVPTISGEFMPEIMSGTTGTIQDLVANNSQFVGTPISNFLTIGGYTFSLTGADQGNAFGPITLVPAGPNTVAIFSVSGTVTGPDFQTPRTYNAVFTAQFAGLTPAQVFQLVDTGGTLPVAFSAEFTVASVIPEPSTYALMGTGLGALGFLVRRRRQSV